MSVAQIFDQTAPLVSGYSMRSKYITDSLHTLGVPLRVYSSPVFSYKNGDEVQNGVPYKRAIIENWETIRKYPIYRELKIINTLKDCVIKNWHDDIKLIDAHSSLLNGVVGIKISRKKNIPFVYEIRALWEDAAVDQGKTKEGSLRYKLTRNMETNIINKADHVTVICEGLKNDLLGRGIPDEKISVIPNGVDTDNFKPIESDIEIQHKYGLKDKIVFGFIGTFFYFEGLEILIRAIKELSIRNNNIKLLLVGSGHEENNLKAQVMKLRLEDKVIFTGRVSHHEIKKYYSVVDIFIYPRISKRITELVTPLKPLEAMAMEKIVIGSDVGGIKELVDERKTGMLFKAEDHYALTDKIQEVIKNIKNMKKMVKEARQFVVEQRNWLKICERYFDIYNKIGIKL